MIGSTKHTSLRETDRIDDPPKQASEIVISAYNIEYILNSMRRQPKWIHIVDLTSRDPSSKPVLTLQLNGEQYGL